MMSRVVLVVVLVTTACLPPPSLARHHTLEPPPHEHPPPAPLRPLPASDGADSDQPPTPASEGNSQGSVAIATRVSQVTQPPGTGRAKRGLYDYGSPWERRVYGRRQTQNRRRGWRRNRSHKYPYDRRRQHHNYRGPDYGDSFHESSHRYNNAGYVDTSAIDDDSSSSRTVSFAQAKASGILRTSTTGGHAEGSA